MADVNVDGNVDFVQSGDDFRIHVWLGNGNGTFQTTPAASTLLNDDGSGQRTSGLKGDKQFFLKDVTADGLPDLVGTNENSGGGITVWFGNGDGRFNPAFVETNPTNGNSSEGLAGIDSKKSASSKM